jgi:hypothetical protein
MVRKINIGHRQECLPSSSGVKMFGFLREIPRMCAMAHGDSPFLTPLAPFGLSQSLTLCLWDLLFKYSSFNEYPSAYTHTCVLNERHFSLIICIIYCEAPERESPFCCGHKLRISETQHVSQILRGKFLAAWKLLLVRRCAEIFLPIAVLFHSRCYFHAGIGANSAYSPNHKLLVSLSCSFGKHVDQKFPRIDCNHGKHGKILPNFYLSHACTHHFRGKFHFSLFCCLFLHAGI